jgi:hypothetical protein
MRPHHYHLRYSCKIFRIFLSHLIRRLILIRPFRLSIILFGSVTFFITHVNGRISIDDGRAGV